MDNTQSRPKGQSLEGQLEQMGDGWDINDFNFFFFKLTGAKELGDRSRRRVGGCVKGCTVFDLICFSAV